MKKLVLAATIFPLLSFAAYAADLPNTKGPPSFAPPPPPVFTWSGLYVGAQVGGAWNSGSFNDLADPNSVVLTTPFFHANDTGVVAGGHIGYNYQINQFVLGVEGSFSYVGINRTDAIAPSPGAFITTRQNWLGTIGPRLGYAFDRLLIYVDGGAAFTSYNFTDFDGTFSSTYGGEHNRVGWTVGAGAEYALTENWIIGIDYKYYDFGSLNLFSGFLTPPFTGAPAGPGLDVLNVRERENSVTARISYKFDMFAPPGAIAAKY